MPIAATALVPSHLRVPTTKTTYQDDFVKVRPLSGQPRATSSVPGRFNNPHPSGNFLDGRQKKSQPGLHDHIRKAVKEYLQQKGKHDNYITQMPSHSHVTEFPPMEPQEYVQHVLKQQQDKQKEFQSYSRGRSATPSGEDRRHWMSWRTERQLVGKEYKDSQFIPFSGRQPNIYGESGYPSYDSHIETIRSPKPPTPKFGSSYGQGDGYRYQTPDLAPASSRPGSGKGVTWRDVGTPDNMHYRVPRGLELPDYPREPRPNSSGCVDYYIRNPTPDLFRTDNLDEVFPGSPVPLPKSMIKVEAEAGRRSVTTPQATCYYEPMPGMSCWTDNTCYGGMKRNKPKVPGSPAAASRPSSTVRRIRTAGARGNRATKSKSGGQGDYVKDYTHVNTHFTTTQPTAGRGHFVIHPDFASESSTMEEDIRRAIEYSSTKGGSRGFRYGTR